MNQNSSVIVACAEECVEVYLNPETDDPIVLIQEGPPGPPGPPTESGKANNIPGADFTGSPKKCVVTFITPYPSTDYIILISGTDSRNYTYENKTINGFTINANASATIVGEVSWFTTFLGETA